MIPNVLSIAGTDPSGGAGIQADIKAISANGGYAMAVVTSLVAQTTTGVSGFCEVPASFVTAQLDVLCADVRVDAVKVGLLPTPEIVNAVADGLARWAIGPVVVDPVLVAKSGDALAGPAVTEALVQRLFPLSDLITPNLSEAGALLGEPVARDTRAMHRQAQALLRLGPRMVLLKGGHLPGPTCTDLLVGANGLSLELSAERVATNNDHGTGCTLSSAIAALRPQRQDWVEAVTDAKKYLWGALHHADALDVGHGHGPVNHFWRA